MRVPKFIEDAEKLLPCKVVYYPEDSQLVVHLKVNNKEVTLCYDEEFIEMNWPYNVFAAVEDDLFNIGLDVNLRRIYFREEENDEKF